MEVVIGIAGLVVALLALAFQQAWLPPKYEMADSHPLQDPVAAKIFGPASVFQQSPRQARVVIRHMVPGYKAEGFRVVRVAFGRESSLGRICVWRGKVSDGSIQECVLMARPKGAESSPTTPPPSGREPNYANSVTDLPQGLDPSRVSWVPASQLSGRAKVLDDTGCEWRLRDPHGDLYLVWKR